jgi:glutamate-ammonia-ligase adenylyltransferase
VLSPQQARERLAALGFRDPAGAMRHLEALTTGVSRRAAIQRTLLPVMLGWFADEADPDAGLLAFRRVSDDLGTIHWYLKMLRDEGSAAERLAHVLGRSRYAADLLIRAPESVSILGDPDGLRPRSQESLAATLRSAAARKDAPDKAMAAVGALRRHELLRIVLGDLTGTFAPDQVGAALADLAGATIEAALDVATRVVGARSADGVLVDVLVVGMGSLGGRELGYGSDADVMIVHRPRDGVSEEAAHRQGVAVVQELVRLVAATAPDAVLLDADLRPEGKNGPLSRSLASYAVYYERWALTWEFQALLRARPIAGDRALWEDFAALIDPLRYPAAGLNPTQIREIRTMKARVESERLPVAPTRGPISSSAGAGSPTSSGPCSCSNCGTPMRCPGCAPPELWRACGPPPRPGWSAPRTARRWRRHTRTRPAAQRDPAVAGASRGRGASGRARR